MSQYLMIFRGSQRQEREYSPEQMQTYMQQWFDWVESMRNKGIYEGGEPLQDGGLTITGNDKIVTDGPYAEAKDLVGGYMLINVDSLDAAKCEAMHCPVYQTGGSVEIRPVADLGGQPD